MVKNHLKRLSSPKMWPIRRKETKYITRPSSGPHTLNTSIPLVVVLRDILGLCKTKKEVRYTLFNKNILVDGAKRKDEEFPVGLFDTINILDKGECFRITITTKGRFDLINVDKAEANTKLCSIKGKSKVKGKTQLNLNDGRSIRIEKDTFKVGDSLLLSVLKQEIKEHFKLEKGMLAMLIKGRHMGEIGTIQEIISNKINFKTNSGEEFETLKEYAFVVGKDKPAITIFTKK